MLELDADASSTAHKVTPYPLGQQIKLRGSGRSNGKAPSEKVGVLTGNYASNGRNGLEIGLDSEMGGSKGMEFVKHYDADGEHLFFVKPDKP